MKGRTGRAGAGANGAPGPRGGRADRRRRPDPAVAGVAAENADPIAIANAEANAHAGTEAIVTATP
ncbi:hypothetical protein, partial [Streptomyces venezuelae]|uniref:hypothetical protein n=1 Tax=Streptomyces venezuelae TaxID=54571 RepID=UPI00278C6ABD